MGRYRGTSPAQIAWRRVPDNVFHVRFWWTTVLLNLLIIFRVGENLRFAIFGTRLGVATIDACPGKFFRGGIGVDDFSLVPTLWRFEVSCWLAICFGFWKLFGPIGFEACKIFVAARGSLNAIMYVIHIVGVSKGNVTKSGARKHQIWTEHIYTLWGAFFDICVILWSVLKKMLWTNEMEHIRPNPRDGTFGKLCFINHCWFVLICVDFLVLDNSRHSPSGSSWELQQSARFGKHCSKVVLVSKITFWRQRYEFFTNLNPNSKQNTSIHQHFVPSNSVMKHNFPDMPPRGLCRMCSFLFVGGNFSQNELQHRNEHFPTAPRNAYLCFGPACCILVFDHVAFISELRNLQCHLIDFAQRTVCGNHNFALFGVILGKEIANDPEITWHRNPLPRNPNVQIATILAPKPGFRHRCHFLQIVVRTAPAVAHFNLTR